MTPSPSALPPTATVDRKNLVIAGRAALIPAGLLALLNVAVGWDWAPATTSVLSLLLGLATLSGAVALLFYTHPKLDLATAALALLAAGMLAGRYYYGAGRTLVGVLSVAALLAGALLLLIAGARFDPVDPIAKSIGGGSPGTLPANWYPDPDDHAQLRYWDGTAWTNHRHPAGGAA